eukprot:2468031-Amphidinium_carterae.2
MQGDEIHNYGRLLERGQVNMLFSYMSDEENDYQQSHFWFEWMNMVTSITCKQESEEVNGLLVRRIRERGETQRTIQSHRLASMRTSSCPHGSNFAEWP